ncbi:MAG: DUF560 domain-containing protein [Gammaproteobacteria bacterium]|nr:DUF560 domain-containing protein [Gammaproteobacteria bacterium]
MFVSQKIASLLLATLLLFSVTVARANDAAITRAWQLVDSAQYQAAFDLLAPLEAEQAGEPIYDYLFGISALRTGQPALALFPLERVLAVQPDHPDARLSFAQAYLAVGNFAAARQEFDLAMQQGNVEPAEAEAFQRELDRKTIGLTHSGGSVELALGYDDNVASATSETTIVTPGTVVALDDDATGIEDGFVLARGSGWLQKPLSKKYRLITAGSILGRFNESADEQNYTAIDARVGLGNRSRANRMAIYLFGTSLDRDSDSYQTSLGLLAQWRYRVSANAHLSSFFRTAQLDYDDLDDRDGLQSLLSVTYVRKSASERSSVYYIGISGGINDPDSSSGDEFGYSMAGFSAGVELPVSDTLRPYAYITYSERNFDDDSSVFGETREDERTTIRLGARFSQVSNWTIKPELVYVDNQSNLTINDYDRTMFSVYFHRDFN